MFEHVWRTYRGKCDKCVMCKARASTVWPNLFPSIRALSEAFVYFESIDLARTYLTVVTNN